MRGRTALVIGLRSARRGRPDDSVRPDSELVTPDLVMLLIIILALTKIRPRWFWPSPSSPGLIIDLLGPSVVGLRAVVFTTIAYIAIRTRERAEMGRLAVALWAGC